MSIYSNEYGMLTELNNSNKSSGAQDKILTNHIIEGTTKLILSITSKDPYKYAKAARHKEPKSLALTSVSLNIPRNKEFRPSDMRDRLPEEIKNIHKSDLSRVISHHDRIGRTTKAENFSPKNKRGHPKSSEPEKLSGPKKYRRASKKEIAINLVLSKEKVTDFIFKSLRRKRLLFKLEKWVNLYKFYVMKNYDKATAWKICKSVFPVFDRGTKFSEEYFKVRKMSKRDLNILAEQKAKTQLKQNSPNDYLYVFKTGAYFTSP